MQRCENCNHDARLLDGVSQVARVDYYRCPVCGEVWTAPKPGDQSATGYLVETPTRPDSSLA